VGNKEIEEVLSRRGDSKVQIDIPGNKTKLKIKTDFFQMSSKTWRENLNNEKNFLILFFMLRIIE